jgi:hypothetical protein
MPFHTLSPSNVTKIKIYKPIIYLFLYTGMKLALRRYLTTEAAENM